MLDKHLHIKVDTETHEWLRTQAHKYGKSIGKFTRRLIEVEKLADESYQTNTDENKTR